jgi:predicted nucleic acid-binding protein
MTLVDSNILLDVISEEQKWADWSEQQLERAALSGPVVINDVVYAEISARFSAYEILDSHLQDNAIEVAPIPRAALFLAGKVFLRYRAVGGVRTGVLSDFFIGAHAAVLGIPILTRDVRRYRSYFPTVKLIAPGDEI